MKTPAGFCPQCHAQTTVVHAADGGCIEEEVWSGRRRVRPATFYACGRCEWAQESAPKEWRKS